MTEKNRHITDVWVQSFIHGLGFIDPQAEHLIQELKPEELAVTSTTLLADPDSRPVLMEAYRKVVKFHHFTKSPDEQIEAELKTQINLVRSKIIHGEYGHVND